MLSRADAKSLVSLGVGFMIAAGGNLLLALPPRHLEPKTAALSEVLAGVGLIVMGFACWKLNVLRRQSRSPNKTQDGGRLERE